MCLSVPGKVVEINGDEFSKTGKVNFSGITKEINLSYVPQAKIGDYVLVHVGFALSVIDEEEANKVFEFLDEINELTDVEERRI